jgi:DNA-binding transcriptional LysR family regulator
MDFKQIEAFVNVARYKSFSKAAEAIYLSQPTVSAHIASLENELNISLFDRAGKEIKITYGGSLFLEYAINLINIRNTAISNLAELDNNISGKLVIASSTTPCRFLLPSLLGEFHNNYNGVSFDIREESSKDVVDMILSGNADIGIVGEILEENKLSYVKIADDNLILISNSKDIPENVTFDQILKREFILRNKGSATRNVFERSLALNGIDSSKLSVFAEVSSLEAVLQLVKYNSGVSIVSELASTDYINTGLIRKHNIINFNITRGIYLVTHNKRTLSPVAKVFYQYVVSKSVTNN